MPIGGATQNQTAYTRDRKTHVRFDIPDPVVLEPPFSIQRGGNDIAREGLASAHSGGPSSGVHKLASGGVCLEWLQLQKHKIHERTDATGAIVRKADWNLIAAYAENPVWRESNELTGITYDAGVQVSGDHFLEKQPPASYDWSDSLAADQTAYPSPVLSSANSVMSRVGVTKVNPYPPNQGIIWRFTVPGTFMHAPDFIMTLMFGGPIEPAGNGEYAVSLTGSGKALIWKRAISGASATWVWVDDFEYCEPNRVCDASHEIHIIPQVMPNGRRIIEFRTSSVDEAAGGGHADLTARYVPSPATSRTHRFELWPVGASAAPGRVTGYGPIRIDVRQDQNPKYQISLAKYLTAGTLVDLPFVFPLATPRTNLVLTWTATVPAGCTIVGKIYDATTNAELSLQSSGASSRTYRPNYGQSAYYVKFALSGSGASTPVLWSYGVTKDGWIETATPGEFDAVTVQHVTATGADFDPSHETASCTVQDLTDSMTRLKTRGRFHSQLEIENDPNDSTKRSAITRGYVIRPKGRVLGKTRKQGLGSGGATRVYPAAGWREFEVNFIAYWNRLKERPPLLIRYFQDDGTGQPYKATDVIRAAFGWAGFPSSMIDVPNLPQRLWPSLSGDDVTMVDPLTDLLEMITKLTRNYLGYVVCFDGNAGPVTSGRSAGMWRIRPPTVSPYTNLASFTNLAQTGKKSVLRCETYNPGITNYVGTNLLAPILTDERGRTTLQTWTNPPENNFVLVLGCGNILLNNGGKLGLPNWFANPKSYDFYADAAGNTVHTADPDHPDYIGTMVPLIIIDPALQTPQAVNFVVRRQVWISCMAYKMATFQAPFLLVNDAADTKQTNPRPLRFYDPVLINGEQFLVRTCSASWEKDGFQSAMYECMAPRDNL